MIDRVLLEILRNYFQAIAESSARVIERTAFTTFVKETADFSTGLIATTGEYIAYPWRIGATPFLGIDMSAALSAIGAYEPGDIVLMNDPYTTGGLSTHLPDLHLLKPIFAGGEIVAFGYAFIHSSDVGGLVPASISPSATDIFQEGLRLRPVRLYRRGILNEDVANILKDNTRLPELNWGDVQAMVAAVNFSERRMLEVTDKFGTTVVRDAIASLLAHVEMRAMSVLRTIPDGDYAFVDYLEEDMVSGTPVRLAVTLRARSGKVHLDFTGTDPQVGTSLNLVTGGNPHPFAALGLIAYVLTYDLDIPKVGSIMRPISMTLPKGSVVNAQFPAACGVRFGTVLRLADVVLGALAKAVPGRVPAASAGATAPVVCSLMDPRTGRRHVTVVQPMEGSGGGQIDRDGIDGREPVSGHTRSTPVESLEADIPIVVRRFHLDPDSGGAGRYRGGMSCRLDFQVFHPDSVVLARGMERFRLQPWGVRGGSCGRAGRTIVNPGTPSARSVGKFAMLALEPGDVVSLRWPAGAGYGDPLDRSVDAVGRDVRSGLVSIEHAEQAYGVVVTNGQVDGPATLRLRERSQRKPESLPEFEFGVSRSELEAYWPAEIADECVRLVETLPVSVRDYVKRRLYAALLQSSKVGPVAMEDLESAWNAVLHELSRALT